MNYGLALPAEQQPQLQQMEDEENRLSIQLYHRVAEAGKLKGKTVLEVGSGRGGGASFILRYHQPAQFTGLDFSEQAVKFCENRHLIPNLKFKVGKAEALPFGSNSFDAVLNIESSHCYTSMEAFVNEVARVLKPGGVFLFTDFRSPGEMEALEQLLKAHKDLRITEEEDITSMVMTALKKDGERKKILIRDLIPKTYQNLFNEFAAMGGSKILIAFERCELIYRRFVLLKHPDAGQ
jgi:ubiquinone/menaquinone biosynthesis C-methylase UbiE